MLQRAPVHKELAAVLPVPGPRQAVLRRLPGMRVGGSWARSLRGLVRRPTPAQVRRGPREPRRRLRCVDDGGGEEEGRRRRGEAAVEVLQPGGPRAVDHVGSGVVLHGQVRALRLRALHEGGGRPRLLLPRRVQGPRPGAELHPPRVGRRSREGRRARRPQLVVRSSRRRCSACEAVMCPVVVDRSVAIKDGR